MENTQLVTTAELCPNPAYIVIHTNWNIKEHPKLEKILNSVWGVERAEFMFTKKYSITIEIGQAFDQEKVKYAILSRIQQYLLSNNISKN